MSKKLAITLLLYLLRFSICDDLDGEKYVDDCEDTLLASDDNSTWYYHTHFRQSVNFYLLTPDNTSIPLNSSNLHLVNTSQPSKVIIHGLGSYENHVWVDKMAAVYHTNGNYNIIAVDWSAISVQHEDYVVTTVDAVGNVVGTFIMEVTKTNTEYLSDVHLIGSSLGAQVGGAAGAAVADKGKKLGRITGLDPTVPHDLAILDEEDAQFVDVIHTSVAMGERGVGRVDFYVLDDEDGEPVCYNRSSNGTIDSDSCTELLASEYYIQTIEHSGRFEGVSCQHDPDGAVRRLCKKAVMGEYVPWNSLGQYLVTKGAAPALHTPGKLVMACLVSIAMYLFI